MKSHKIQRSLFASLISISVLSAVYLNGEAKELELQGYDVVYMSTKNYDYLTPDIKFISNIVDNLKDVFLLD